MVPQLIVFDCDGVLVDSEALVVETEAELLSAAGFPITSAEIIERFVGISYTSMMTEIGVDHGRPVPLELQERVQQLALDRFGTDLEPVKGMPELLGGLTAERCVASSSNLDRIRLSLRVCGIDHHFAPDRLFSAQMVQRGKPAPDLFLHAARELGTDPAACLVIEDSVPGVTAAVAAGMAVIGLVAGSHARLDLGGRLLAAGATAVHATVADLGTHLESLLADPG